MYLAMRETSTEMFVKHIVLPGTRVGLGIPSCCFAGTSDRESQSGCHRLLVLLGPSEWRL